MAFYAFAGTLAVSFLFEAVGSNLGFSGCGLVGAIASMGAFLIYVIDHPHTDAKTKDGTENEKDA